MAFKRSLAPGPQSMGRWAGMYAHDLIHNTNGRKSKYPRKDVVLWCRRYDRRLKTMIDSGDQCPPFMEYEDWVVHLEKMRKGFRYAERALVRKDVEEAVRGFKYVLKSWEAGRKAWSAAKREHFQKELKDGLEGVEDLEDDELEDD